MRAALMMDRSERRADGWARHGLVLLLAVVLLFLVGAPYARACDCDPLSFDEAVDKADLIAKITIVGESEKDSPYVTYVAAVERVWKGEESREIRFSTAEHTASCGLGRLPVGETLTVWATGGDGDYSSTWCNLPYEAEDDLEAQLTRELGEPADLSDQPAPTVEDPSAAPTAEPEDEGSPLGIGTTGAIQLGVVGLAVLGLLMAAAIVTVVLVRRRARNG